MSSQSSNSDPQLGGHTSFLTVPPSPRPPISLPAQSCCPPSPGNVHPHSSSQHPPVSTLFLQPAPQFHPGTPPLLSHCCPGALVRPCPHLCAQTLGQCHPVSVASGTSLLLSISGQPGPWDTLIWSAPSPRDTGKGAHTSVPLPGLFGQDCPEGSGLAPCPTVHLLPAPLGSAPPSPVPGTEGSPALLRGADCHPPLPRSRAVRGTPCPTPASGSELMSPDSLE